MNRRRFLQAATAALAAPARGAKPPNFLFLFTDDQRFNTLHALDNPEVRTPNMDRLVRRGVTFTHAFTQGGLVGAICMPSRGMLMTGQTLFHVHDNLIAPEKAPAAAKRPYTTFPETLRRAGYTTVGTGKWHNGPELYNRSFSRGENIFFGGMSDHLKVPVQDYDPSGGYPKSRERTGAAFSSELFAGSAIKFLRAHDRNSPFLLYCAFTAPHDPRMAPKRFTDLYPPEKIKVPANFFPAHPFDNGELKVRDELLAPFPRTPEIAREHIAAYYAMITEVDEQIGRVLEALEASGDAGNTYIVFAADNGLAVGQHGLFGKQNLYDHSLRVPLVINGPGVAQSVRTDSLCYLMDVCPTVCELAGLPVPSTVESKSLRPLLANRAAKLRDCVISAYRHYQRAIRTERWKLVLYNVDGKKTTQLFDLAADPLEMRNLADDPAQQSRIRELRAQLRRELEAAGDRLDLDAPRWAAYAGCDAAGDD